MLSTLIKGGILMVPLILCSLIALTIFIEKIKSLKQSRIDTDEFMKNIRLNIKQNQVNMAIFNCEKTPGPLARVVLAALKNSHIGKIEAQEAVQESAMQEIPSLEKRLGVLATIANITPLLGLLGTVMGMIKAFSVIQAKGIGHAGELAGGISQALITTATGLTIAIPTLVAYNYLSTNVDERIHEIEKSSQETLNLLFHKRDEQVFDEKTGE